MNWRPLLAIGCALAIGSVHALDESLERSFGTGRVKIRKLDAPKEISQSKLQASRARYDAQMRICRGKSDRQKQYCMQQAETEFRIEQRNIRRRAQEEEQRRNPDS